MALWVIVIVVEKCLIVNIYMVSDCCFNLRLSSAKDGC